MIVACPSCSARYRVDPGEVPERARLRCARCQTLFRVSPPAAVAPGERPRGVDRRRLVVVADPDIAAARLCGEELTRWGLQPMLVHDGVEAMLAIQRLLPRAVVLDAAVASMSGAQVCEIVKRNESLRKIAIALVAEADPSGARRSRASELYGPDVFLDREELPGALEPFLRRAGLPVIAALEGFEAPAPTATVPALKAPAPRVPAPVSRAPLAGAAPAPQAASPDDPLAAERAAAERLARIIVSDILLYNPEKFSAGLASGDPADALAAELEEGRALLRRRVDPRVRDQCDFLGQELARVVRAKAAR